MYVCLPLICILIMALSTPKSFSATTLYGELSNLLTSLNVKIACLSFKYEYLVYSVNII